MRWNRKSMVSLALSGLLAIFPLAGCNKKAPEELTGAGEGGTVAMGRYIEESWELPLDSTGVTALHKTADGKIAVLGYPAGSEEMRYYSTVDGSSWQEETPSWLAELKEQGGMVSDLHFNSKGEGVVVYHTAGYATQKIAQVGTDGTVTATPIGEDGNPFAGEGGMRFSLPMAGGTGTVMIDGDENAADTPGTEKSVEAVEPGPDGEEDSESPGLSDNAAGMESNGAVFFSAGPDGEAGDGEDSGNTVQFSGMGGMYVDKAYRGEDGLIYLKSMYSVGAFDPETGELVGEMAQGITSFALVDGQVAGLQEKNAAASLKIPIERSRVVFLEGGKELRTQDIDFLQEQQSGRGIMWSGQSGAMAGGEDGALYLAESSGLYRLASSGESWEKIVDGGLSSLSLPSMMVGGILPHGENEFLLLFYGEQTRLLNYVYSPETPTLPDKELTVFTLRQDATLSQAIGAFRKANPNVLVNVRSAADEEGLSTADAIRALNTELLAGKGPDLILLDRMPLDSYMEKGVLADLRDVVEPMVSSGELYGNLVSSLQNEEGLFAVPTRLSIPTFWGEKDAVAAAGSLEALVEYAEKNPDKRVLADLSPERLLFDFGRASQKSLLTGSGQVDVEALERLYDLVGRLSATANGEYTLGSALRTAAGTNGAQESVLSDSETRWEELSSSGLESIQSVFTSKADLLAYELNSISSAMMPNSSAYFRNGGKHVNLDGDATTTVPDSEVKQVFRSLSGLESGSVFYPASVIGVNAAGEQQELAKDFVKAMLGEETQSVGLESGFPVNRLSMQKAVDNDETAMRLSAAVIATDSEDDPGFLMEASWPSKAMREALAETAEALEIPLVEDQNTIDLIGMIIDESESFFDGGISAREAAEAVADKAKIRLAE